MDIRRPCYHKPMVGNLTSGGVNPLNFNFLVLGKTLETQITAGDLRSLAAKFRELRNKVDNEWETMNAQNREVLRDFTDAIYSPSEEDLRELTEGELARAEQRALTLAGPQEMEAFAAYLAEMVGLIYAVDKRQAEEESLDPEYTAELERQLEDLADAGLPPMSTAEELHARLRNL